MLRDPVAEWRELSALYEQAESLEGSERTRFLDSLREASHPLLADLERLLGARARAETEGFLEALPTLPAPADRVADEWREGSRVGAYRLARHIGSGGMAEVWLADRVDGAFERQVAIKLLFNHPTRAQRDTFVERFRRERDILASLHHPNIAALHDAGVTPSGQPWLALEYVSGASITAWCDHKRLTLRERVRVFRQGLLAVEHAHANLIIHRDLKPSNILVTEQGEVKLLDFGIAKLMDAGLGALDDTELTRQGGRPLTLQYASPEQLGGRPLTTASDVYSLGVVLYELLSGARPFDAERSRSAARLEDAILLGNIPPPSRRSTDVAADARRLSGRALVRALSGDLDAVTCKALSGDTRRRYASVEALRLDVDRWCEGRPVRAQPAKLAYRMRKFYLRHRLAVWSGAAALSVVLGLGSAAVVNGLKAQSESGRAIAARDFLMEMFRGMDPEQARGTDVAAHQVLEAGRSRAMRTLAQEPELQAEVLTNIGEMQRSIGHYTSARTTLEQVVNLYGELGQPSKLAAAQINLALTINQLGDVGEAAALIQRVRVAEGARELQAQYRWVRGLIADAQGDSERAKADFLAALAYSDPLRKKGTSQSVEILRALAMTERDLGRFDAALQRLREASVLAAEGADVGARDVFGIQRQQLRVEIESGNYVDAPARLATLVSRCDELLGADREDCTLLINLRTKVLLRIGSNEDALALLPRLLVAARNIHSPRRQIASAAIAVQVAAANGKAALLAQLRPDLVAMGEASAQSVEDRCYALTALAQSFLLEDEPVRAEAWAARSLALQSTTSSSLRRTAAEAKLIGALARRSQGRDAEALSLLEEAVADIAAHYGAGHPLVALYRLNGIPSLVRRGETETAFATLDASLRVLVASFGESAPVTQTARRMQNQLARRDAGTESDPFAYYFI